MTARRTLRGLVALAVLSTVVVVGVTASLVVRGRWP